MAIIFDSKSLCGDLIKELQARNACKEAIDWINNTVSQEQSIDELLDAYLLDTKSPEAYSIWVLQNIYDVITQEVRNRFIDKIIDPMGAFLLYIECKELNETEDKLLVQIFEGKLPVAEKELMEKVIQRKLLCQ